MTTQQKEPPSASGAGSSTKDGKGTGQVDGGTTQSGGIKGDEPTNWQLVKRMASFLRCVRKEALITSALVVIGGAVEIQAALMQRSVVNTVQDKVGAVADAHESIWQQFHHDPMRGIIKMILVLAVLVATNAGVRMVKEISQMKFSMNLVYHMRAAIYDRLQRVGFSFHDVHSSGTLINRSLQDLQNIRMFILSGLLASLEIIVFVVGYNITIFRISHVVGLMALVPIPFWLLYIRYFSKRMQKAQRAQMKSGDDMVTVLTENIAGVHVVKAFATEKTEIRKFNKATDTFFDRVMDTVRLSQNFVPVMRGIASASHLSLFAVGAALVVMGRGKVGDLLFYGGAMGAILGRLQMISQISDQYQRAIVSARRFYEVLDAPAAVPEIPHAPKLPPGRGAVEFNFVTFGYSREKPVVKDIAFDIEGGGVVAVVGPTGSGKSTLVALMARFYDPDNGSILIDGVDIKKVNLDSLRRNIGFVFQETFLFSETVANNISYGCPSATRGDIEAAARIAQAHDFIMEMPRGYDTMLSEKGATLSGGQRQRLAIARAIVSNPRILVLDDALAAVDPETEHLISRALELVMVDRTVFIIAHRLSTVKAADLVIVLEGGRITQAGTHKELLRAEGHYRHIAQVQLAYQETELLAGAAKTADIAAGQRRN